MPMGPRNPETTMSDFGVCVKAVLGLGRRQADGREEDR